MREKPCLGLLDAVPGEKVLDVGCGLGYFLLSLTEKEIECHGIDTSAESLAYVQEHITPHTKVGTCLDIPYEENTFDKAMFCEVIEHIADDTAALREICRVLKPGGRLVVSTPAYEGWLTRTYLKRLGHHDGGEYHERDGYFAKDLEKALEENGFRIIKTRLSMFLLSELFMEMTKVVYMFKKKTFEAQSDLLSVQKSLSFRILKLFLPVIIFFSRLEDALMIPLFRKGHALIVCAEKR
jgi:ubiquinone/menaquinone biosynthesis C-methylase UbiE